MGFAEQNTAQATTQMNKKMDTLIALQQQTVQLLTQLLARLGSTS